jgi:hypothetical protein
MKELICGDGTCNNGLGPMPPIIYVTFLAQYASAVKMLIVALR